MMEMIESAVNSPLEYTQTVKGMEEREARTRARTHTEIMSDQGFETPAPMPKRFRNAWEHLVGIFPCPPELQHRLWAARVKRMFQGDRGFLVDWMCECT